MNETRSMEDRLRAEVEDLKRQLEEQKRIASGEPRTSGPAGRTLLMIGLVIAGLIVAGFFAGYPPRHRREEVLAAESKDASESLPAVNVTKVTRSDKLSELVLPAAPM